MPAENRAADDRKPPSCDVGIHHPHLVFAEPKKTGFGRMRHR